MATSAAQQRGLRETVVVSSAETGVKAAVDRVVDVRANSVSVAGWWHDVGTSWIGVVDVGAEYIAVYVSPSARAVASSRCLSDLLPSSCYLLIGGMALSEH
ncbi:unnamed protein product, partial [Ectocarpus sp. 13 AM-2016]